MPLAEPVVFGTAERPLAGMFHSPRGTPRGAGVVLCNPFGYEAICAHQTYRHLADRLARDGFAVLRFDYDGTGDSIGDDRDPARIAAWCASVGAALDWLKRERGAQSLGLFGTRFGALLAAEVATQRSDISTLALWAPILSGRAFVREARAFRMLHQSPGQFVPPSRAEAQHEEAAGFLLQESTIADAGALDLLSLARSPAPSTLIIPRDDLPSGEERLVEHLRGLDATLEIARETGYASLLVDPHASTLPATVVERVASFFARAHPAQPFAAVSERAPSRFVGDGFVEEAARFGASRLFGIATLPSAPSKARVAVVFLNVGAVHHVGSNRMYVQMARDWARQGIPSLRFDLSGLGESPPQPGEPEARLSREQAPDEVRAAFDHLRERTGVERFALVGLCSGGYVAYHTARVDPRVAALVLINPQTYLWRPEDGLQIKSRQAFRSTRFYRRAALRRETWRRLLRDELHLVPIARTLAGRGVALLRSLASSVLGRGGSEVEQALRAISERGAHTYFLFSGDDGGIDALEEHLGKNARRLSDFPNVRHEIIDGTDHTFTPGWSQDELSRRLAAFLRNLAQRGET